MVLLNKNRFVLFALVIMASLLLAACSAPVTTWPGLSADGTRAYLASGNQVYAINLQNGVEIWRYPQEADGALIFSAAPTLTPDGQLLVGSAGSERALISLNPETGAENWSAPFTGAEDTWVAAPLAVGDFIYAPNTDGNLYVLDLQGKLVDQLELGGALWSQPSTDGTLLYVASLDHELHIIDPVSRAVVATTDLGGSIPGGVSIGADGVYAGTFASRVERIRPDGSHHSLTTTKEWVWGAPALDGETLYLTDMGGNVYSLDMTSGAQNWGEVKPNGPITASPLVVGDHIIVVTDEGRVYALNKDGGEAWHWPVDSSPDGKFHTAAIAAGEMILVAPFQDNDSLLVALDQNGRAVWSFKPQ